MFDNIIPLIRNMHYLIGQFHLFEKQGYKTPRYYRELNAVCRYCRRLAIARLLFLLDVKGFLLYLGCAGEYRLRLLKTLPNNPEFREYGYSSDPYGFFDSFSAGNLAIAKAIAEATLAAFDPDLEYRDDYLYTRFLRELVKNDFKENDHTRRCLLDFKENIASEPTSRYTICESILKRDATGFHNGLFSLISEHEQLFEKKGVPLISDKSEYGTERFVAVEGLALLFIADHLGIATDKDYRYMPENARYHSIPESLKHDVSIGE